ncbi:hypothetical protein LOD99_10037 [Oopsacas minuta]|uniref:2-oxo-4-hydroxy-4-carboxy-5-ureidoimidazoline decarboxylase n=1 Tax=Oopsacas minuta TaxID=111878 RepID=A0AAV7KKD8_9METZ|nr:hypothetical protein LOD99_10037 [Oopsacas minuta]
MSDIACLSKGSYVTFRNELSGIIEDGAWIAGALFDLKPFVSIEDYYTKLCDFLSQLSVIAQVGIIRCYPQLISTDKTTLSKESTDEHEMRFKNISTSSTLTIRELNSQYIEKFQFPFISCVKENSVENILELMHARIGNTYQEEVKMNMQQIQRIAWYRLVDKFKLEAKL